MRKSWVAAGIGIIIAALASFLLVLHVSQTSSTSLIPSTERLDPGASLNFTLSYPGGILFYIDTPKLALNVTVKGGTMNLTVDYGYSEVKVSPPKDREALVYLTNNYTFPVSVRYSLINISNGFYFGVMELLVSFVLFVSGMVVLVIGLTRVSRAKRKL